MKKPIILKIYLVLLLNIVIFLHVFAGSPSTTNITICNNQLPYQWNNITCLTAGTYQAILAAANGGDSVAILNLSVINVGTSITNAIVCDNELPYQWNGHDYTASGTYSVTLTNAGGCDSVPILSLTVNHFVTSTTSTTVCSNLLPYNWNGNSYITAGNYKVTLKSAAGCDSIASLNLTVKPGAASTTAVTICSNQIPYTWNGRNYTAAGLYAVTLLAANGCDSVASLDLKVNPVSSSISTATVCSDQLPYNWNGNNYNAAGTYPVTLKNYLNCDSVANLILTVLPVNNSTSSITICDGQLPYTWNGNVYATAGLYAVTLNGTNGCDSVANLQLSSSTFLTSTTDVTICSSELPYNWNNDDYTTAGNYTVPFVTATGCDSFATLNLTVTTPYKKTDSLFICRDLLPYNYHGHILTTAGDYEIVPPYVVNACQSIDSVYLQVQLIPPGFAVVKICNNQLPYNWNGQSYTTPGKYSLTLTSVDGCDSTVNLDLSINPLTALDTSVTICTKQVPYSWNGNFYSSSGTYITNLTSSGGCDSVVTLHLTIVPVKTSVTAIEICNAQVPYTWNGNTYTSSGSYDVTLTGSEGCDSVASLHLFVQNSLTSSTNITVCNNQLPYSWNGNAYSTAGVYVADLISNAGCDSVATLNLAINNVIRSTTDINTCTYQLPYSWNGNTYAAAGTYSVTLITAAGCDSVATLNLYVNAPDTSTTDLIICNNQLPYTWNGNIYPIAGTYPVILTSSTGCDSVAILHLVVKAILTSTTNLNVCNKDLPYIWNGNSYAAGGTYSVTLTTAAGCDSVPILSLTIVPYISTTTDLLICNNQLPYTWNGNTYAAAGTYSVLFSRPNNCDSLAILNLSVRAPITSTTNTSVCPSQLPYNWNGKTYTATGTYTSVITNSIGCDSTATLNLIVLPVAASSTTVTVCNDQLPYQWNGHSYTAGGTYPVTFTGSNGCDSVASLQLMVNPVVSSTSAASICSAQLPYNWNGQNFTTAGLHRVTLNSIAGCDSVATLDLIINATPLLPATSPVAYCQYNNVLPLAATITSAGSQLLWYTDSTGGTGSNTSPTPSSAIAGNTDFYVSQVNGSCEGPRAVITVTVSEKPVLGPDKDIKVCYGDSLNLSLLYTTTGYQSNWTFQGQPVSFPHSVRVAGNYQLLVTTSRGCLDTSIVTVAILPPVFADAGRDDNAEYNGPYQLSGNGNGLFEWMPPGLLNNAYIPDPVAVLDHDESFILKISNELGCTAYDTVKLRVLKGPGFYVPSAFSPNGDGINDVFRPTAVGIANLEYFRIFNRYGEKVFETNIINKGWDGIYKGVKQSIGNYVWMLKGTNRFGELKHLKGNVVLVR